MTIETLNAIKAQAEALQESTLDLGGALDAAESSGVILPVEVDTAFADLTTNLYTILEWVNQAIEDGTGEEPQVRVMGAFLAELKLVFEKYSATLRIIESGYGLDYGGSGAENVIQFTVSRDGTTEVKDFIQTSLIAADLI